MPKDPLHPDRLLPEIESVTLAAQQMTNDLSQRANAASIHAAIITGYRMACVDNGIAVPDFADPKLL